MTPPFSFAVRFEDPPLPTRSVRVALPSLGQPASSRLGNLASYWPPSRTLGRIGSRGAFPSPPPPPPPPPPRGRQRRGGRSTLRITSRRRPNEPLAAASFNPVM